MDAPHEEADGIGQTFVSPEGPGTGPREPLPEEPEIEEPGELIEGHPPSEPGDGLQGAELLEAVKMLEGLKQAAGQGEFEIWQRMVLMWGLKGLDVDLDWPPQPWRAGAAVVVVGGSCLMEANKSANPRPPKLEDKDDE